MAKKSAVKKKKETPLMGQYNRIKAKYPDALLLFRVGDFYETFSSDAITTANVLGIVLTKRNNGAAGKTELAGFPHHALDTYLPKLVKAGYRVAICDQLEDPKKTKKLVKRGVTELITPGVALNDQILDQNKNTYLASVVFEGIRAGVAFLDLSTGEFMAAEGSSDYIDKLISGFSPGEIIFSRPQKDLIEQRFGNQYYTYALDEWILQHDFAYEKLLDHFKVTSLKGFGLDGQKLAATTAGAVLHYMFETEHPNLLHVRSIQRMDEGAYMWLDRFTIRNLEILQSHQPNGTSLSDVLDHTLTPMGGRLLRRWLVLPLKDSGKIKERQHVVEGFVKDEDLRNELSELLKQLGDIERIASKISTEKIGPNAIVALRQMLENTSTIKDVLQGSSEPFQHLADGLLSCPEVTERIVKTIKEGAPALISKGNVIAEGVSDELDELRELSLNARDKLLEIQQRESEITGIPSLKIGFNNVFGYYLEVTNKYKEQVPEVWIRKQTLTGSERYITEELKDLEQKILTAEDRMLVLETELFADLVHWLKDFIPQFQTNGYLLAQIDCLLCFANVSVRNNYCKPVINDGLEIDIRQGRHAVIEKQLPLGEAYVPNDLYLNDDSQQIIVITGPNMSGKSAILRQAALIVLMAQMGCYVPAESAELGIVDKLFTRVGASDNLSLGESTFMVEMLETASIMNNISDRSLILLDEIGRGTSTYDGISIAWSIAEYLHENKMARPKTLFATHYHELNELAEQFHRVKNFHVATKEVNNSVIFLRQLKPGGSHHSFGIHVAKMAGMPNWIVHRAQEILSDLEQKHVGERDGIKEKLRSGAAQYQLSIFDAADPAAKEILDELENMDLNAMTPIEAMMKLNELKRKRSSKNLS